MADDSSSAAEFAPSIRTRHNGPYVVTGLLVRRWRIGTNDDGDPSSWHAEPELAGTEQSDGQVAGYAAYHREPGVITFLHTIVEPAFEGRGVASAIARASLDRARAAR